MLVQTRHTYHRCLLHLVQEIASSQTGPLRVGELARRAGFSRGHLSRMFTQTLCETPAEFERRMRLERAAFLIRHDNVSVHQASLDAGYATPEAFCRAFTAAYGIPPSRFRTRETPDWKLPSPSRTHWKGGSRLDRFVVPSSGAFEMMVVERRSVRMAALRHMGPMSERSRTWRRVFEACPDKPWMRPGSQLMTVYHDSIGSRPIDQIRTDIGFSVRDNDPLPDGFHEVRIPGGVYAASLEHLTRAQHPKAWDVMNRQWVPPTSDRRPIPAIDEHAAWPTAGEDVPRRLLVGLELELRPAQLH